MLKVSNVEVLNLKGAIRGMRNPMNSWHKSDSFETHIEDPRTLEVAPHCYFIGDNDLELGTKLCNAGSDHRKFLRQIMVCLDIDAPLYWWKEFDTYKVGTVANSCSTMHKIHDKEFTLDDFSHEHLLDSVIGDDDNTWVSPLEMMRLRVEFLNLCRKRYIETKNKMWWWQMIQLLPSSYNQMRTITLNYEVLRNMYHARRHHKLDEWHTFCDWVETLPYAKEFIIGE